MIKSARLDPHHHHQQTATTTNSSCRRYVLFIIECGSHDNNNNPIWPDCRTPPSSSRDNNTHPTHLKQQICALAPARRQVSYYLGCKKMSVCMLYGVCQPLLSSNYTMYYVLLVCFLPRQLLFCSYSCCVCGHSSSSNNTAAVVVCLLPGPSHPCFSSVCECTTVYVFKCTAINTAAAAGELRTNEHGYLVAHIVVLWTYICITYIHGYK